MSTRAARAGGGGGVFKASTKGSTTTADELKVTEEPKVIKSQSLGSTVPGGMSGIKAYQYSMKGHAQSCVEKYCQMTGTDISTLKAVPTPCLDDHMIPPEDFSEKGKLHTEAAKVVMKIAYLAQQNRPDCLWAVN